MCGQKLYEASRISKTSREHFYVRNAQGDIIGLVNGAGDQVASYVYDTWGKLVSISGSLAGSIGELNPYRYRGYRFDSETGLYYLQSRYYNPEWGRFINADAHVGVQGELFSANMFPYCANNPVNKSDSTGFWFGIDDAIAACVGAVTGLVCQNISDVTTNILAGKRGVSAL